MTDQELIIRISGSATEFIDELNKAKKKTEDLEKSLVKTAKISGAAFAALTAAAFGATQAFAQYETALVGVGKTTNISGQDLQRIGNSFRQLSQEIPVATNELLAIAQAGGQLGISAEEDLLKFTETVAKLGSATDLSGEQAATSLARILNITNESIGTIDRLGSVIVRLGNNFAASESEIVRVATEVARSTNVFKLSSAEVAGLSTALKALGIQAQLGGSAVGRAFREIDATIRAGGEGLSQLSEVTGIAGAELQKQFGENAVGVFQAFIEGLGRIQQQGGSAADELAKFGLVGDEINKVLPVLASGSGLLGEALAQANDEVENGNALNAEAAVAFATLASEQTKLRNTFANLSSLVGAELAPGFKDLVITTREILSTFTQTDSSAARIIATFLKVTGVITGLTFAVAALTLAYVKSRALLIAFNQTLVTNGIVLNRNTIITNTSAAAQKAWNAVLATGDFILKAFRNTLVLTGRAIFFLAGFLNPIVVAQRAYNAAVAIGNTVTKAYRVTTLALSKGLGAATGAINFFTVAANRQAIATRAASLATALFTRTANIAKLAVRGLVGATGIGLLLVALSLIVENWDKVKAASIATLSAVTTAFRVFASRVGNIIGAVGDLLKNVFTLNFSEVRGSFDKLKDELGKAFTDIGEAAAKEFDKSYKKSLEESEAATVPQPEVETGEDPTKPGPKTGDELRAEADAAKRLREIRARELELSKQQQQQAANERIQIKDEELKRLQDEENKAAAEAIKIKQEQLEALKEIDRLQSENAELERKRSLSDTEKVTLEANQRELEQRQLQLEELRALETQSAELQAIEQAERDQAKLDRIEEQAEEERLLREELNALSEEERDLLDEEDIEKARLTIESKRELERQAAAEQLAENIARRKQFIKDEQKFGKDFANLRQLFASQEVELADQTAGQLVQLTRSKNAQLKSIGKAASLVQIGIKTAEGAISAYASLAGIPIVGPVLGAIAAGALIAFGAEQAAAVTSAQRGGIVPPGGGGSNDRIPALLQPGELVVPAPLAPDFIQSVGRPEIDNESEGGGGMDVTIGFTEDAIPFIEQKLLERRAIGTGSL